MPVTVFGKPINNIKTTVGATYTAGSGSLTVGSATGITLTAGQWCRVSTFRSGTPMSILKVTSVSGNVLTVDSAIEGTTDVNLVVGDAAELRITAGAFTDVHSAINAIESSVTDIMHLDGVETVTGAKTFQTVPTLGTLSGVLKGSSGVLSAASPGTDYVAPTGSGAGLTGITASQVGAAAAGDTVNLTGNQTVAGDKSFTSAFSISTALTGSVPSLKVQNSTSAPNYAVEFHAKDNQAWLAGFWNDTYSATDPVFQYFGWDHGSFSMGTGVARDVVLYTGSYNANPSVVLTGENYTSPSSKRVGINKTYVSSGAAYAVGATLEVDATAGDNVPTVAIKAASGQTQNLQEWQNSSGTPVASVSAAGVFSGSGASLTGITASQVGAAGDSLVVHLAGTESITGAKTFTPPLNVAGTGDYPSANLTSFNAPAPYVVTESSEVNSGNQGWMPFDGNTTTDWLSAGATGWLKIDMGSGSPVTPTSYTIAGVHNSTTFCPNTWTFEGSNNDSTWATLDTQTGVTWGSNGQIKVFTVTTSTAYRYFKINITVNNSGQYVGFSSFKITGTGVIFSVGATATSISNATVSGPSLTGTSVVGLTSVTTPAVTSTGLQLALKQTGDQYGTTSLTLRNRAGLNGALFTNETLDLVDFGFVASSGVQQNIRFEHRNATVADLQNSTGEFQFIFSPAAGYKACLAVGIGSVCVGATPSGFTVPVTNFAVGGTPISTSYRASIYSNAAGCYPLAIKLFSGQTAPAVSILDSNATPLTTIRADGSISFPTLTDASAVANSLYYSSTQSKLVYKDAGGTANPLY